MFGVGEILCPETAANIGRDEAHRGRVDTERSGGHVAVAVDVLAGEMQSVATVVLTDSSAWFHRVGNDTVVVQLDRYDMWCGLEGVRDLGGLAPVPVEAEVAGDLGGQDRGFGSQRVASPNNCRQGLEVDDDAFRGIQGLVAGLRDDQGDGFADVADDVLGQ